MVVSGDALRVFHELIPDDSLAAVHVYFPDPWWKKRHKKRRVMRESFLRDVERTLQPGGQLHFWTDVEEYFRTTLELAGRVHDARRSAAGARNARRARHGLPHALRAPSAIGQRAGLSGGVQKDRGNHAMIKLLNGRITCVTLVFLALVLGGRAWAADPQVNSARRNLVPDRASGSSLNYWCTWSAQHPMWYIKTDEELKTFDLLKATEGGNAARRRMDQAALFDDPGWATNFWPRLRADLYLCLDDGWDVPYGVDAKKERWRFGSLILNEERFPDFKGTPAERLRSLNAKVKSLGWRGLALWVAAQCEGDKRDGQYLTPEACEAYWRERARWSAQAGIEYWKVDWGARDHDEAFRRMLTKVAREEAPNLVVEHVVCMAPVNNPKGNGHFRDWAEVAKPSLEYLSFSDSFRSYDVMGGLANASTLDRIATWLAEAHLQPPARGIINCEDNPYMGAAMGFSIGVMSVPVRGPYTKWQWPRIDEASRALRWQRLAPAFGVGANRAYAGDRILIDSKQVGADFWFRQVAGKKVEQYAPAVMSRGVALPIVACEGEPPFVVASRNPHGATAVATLPRCVDDKTLYPPADVTLGVQDGDQPIGVFGKFRTLTLRFSHALASPRVSAQDLLADEAQDITQRVKVSDHAIILDGELISEVGRAAATAQDPSGPGLILKLETQTP